MVVDILLVGLCAGVLAFAAAKSPLVAKAKRHFYEPENEGVREWAYFTDAFFARLLLTGLLGTCALLLGFVMAKGLHMKGVPTGVYEGFRVGALVATVGVLAVGLVGALKQNASSRQALAEHDQDAPERENRVLATVIFILVAAVSAPAIYKALMWVSR